MCVGGLLVPKPEPRTSSRDGPLVPKLKSGTSLHGGLLFPKLKPLLLAEYRGSVASEAGDP